MSFTLTVGYTTSNKIVLVDYSPWCVLLCLSSTTTWTFIHRQTHVCNVVSEWDYDLEFPLSPTEVDALNIAVLYPNPTTTILNFLDKLWFCFGHYTQNSAPGTLIHHHRLCPLIWHGVAASCKKHFSCLLIAVCLSRPVCGSASHREVVHTPVIHRLQRLALDIVCHDCHWCVCMQVNWYPGSMSHSLVDSCVCVMIWDDMIPQESATQQAWWAVFNDDPIANIMAQMIQ